MFRELGSNLVLTHEYSYKNIMPTKTKIREIELIKTERKTTIISEAPYAHGVLIRIESDYKNRDGSHAIAEAVTFVPSPRELKK